MTPELSSIPSISSKLAICRAIDAGFSFDAVMDRGRYRIVARSAKRPLIQSTTDWEKHASAVKLIAQLRRVGTVGARLRIAAAIEGREYRKFVLRQEYRMHQLQQLRAEAKRRVEAA